MACPCRVFGESTLRRFLLLACLSVFGTYAAFSASSRDAPASSPRVFSQHDANRDGNIDRREYYRFRQRIRARRGHHYGPYRIHDFDAIDSNRDHQIDEAELLDILSAPRMNSR